MNVDLRVLLVSFALCTVALVPTPAMAADDKKEEKGSGADVDKDLPEYTPVQGISGSLKSVGSDTMNNLMSLWAEGFRKHYPNVTVEVEGKGSGTAPPALIAGQADFGPMSRPMKSAEEDEFEKKFGYKPTALATSIDALAVFVNKDNPIDQLSLPQLDAIFSKGRNLGFEKDIRTWGQLEITGAFEKKVISLNGRNSASGTYTYFKEHVLGKGDFKDSVKEHPGTSAVVQAVASDKFGIGYGGIGFLTSDVRAVPIAATADSEAVPPEAETALSGDYPLARNLYVYINYKPGSDLSPLRREFIRYVFSRDGQSDVVKDGYIPMPAKVAAKMLKSIGVESE